VSIWTYHDWRETSGLVARRARLRQHMTEVAGRIEAARTAGGQSRSAADLVNYLQGLKDDERDLTDRIGDESRGFDMSFVDLTSAGS
jgi:hypothetical protein